MIGCKSKLIAINAESERNSRTETLRRRKMQATTILEWGRIIGPLEARLDYIVAIRALDKKHPPIAVMRLDDIRVNEFNLYEIRRE